MFIKLIWTRVRQKIGFEGSPVYSWGHRNPQGIAWHPQTHQLFSTEHGQSTHDEINLINSGENYGWPVIEGDQKADGMNSPLLHSGKATWAPSGMTFVTQGPWEGELIAANLRGQQLLGVSLDFSDESIKVLEKNVMFQGEFGRIRDVFEGPDGTVYFLTNNHDGRGNPAPSDDRIMMLVPEF
jgi:glucose/arabinose dehydrogenase